uniref:Uncharacterized protein n=1 Tax=Pyxicephalus adspersus TaxID=30357 RepID=A0AAV3ABK0_PYXAD|nr:TPA: hypothetical protein GDO54_017229 [Pyxicephalus adspersus]
MKTTPWNQPRKPAEYLTLALFYWNRLTPADMGTLVFDIIKLFPDTPIAGCYIWEKKDMESNVKTNIIFCYMFPLPPIRFTLEL